MKIIEEKVWSLGSYNDEIEYGLFNSLKDAEQAYELGGDVHGTVREKFIYHKIYDSPEEFMEDGRREYLKEQGLKRLTTQQRAVLGLPDPITEDEPF